MHRDVKPENVLIGEDGRVKVGDFGLARAVDASPLTATTGLLLGTVAYLAPEQVRRGVADARTDVYAAGVLLFEMLTGRPPFEGDTALSVAYQHLHDRVPAPSTFNPDVPEELDELVLQATEPDPDHRPIDAAAMLDDLRHIAVVAAAGPWGAAAQGRAAAGPGLAAAGPSQPAGPSSEPTRHRGPVRPTGRDHPLHPRTATASCARLRPATPRGASGNDAARRTQLSDRRDRTTIDEDLTQDETRTRLLGAGALAGSRTRCARPPSAGSRCSW